METVTSVLEFLQTWGALLISGLSFLIAVVSLVKSSRAQKLQNKVNGLELLLKQSELEKIAKEKAEANSSCVEARAISMGTGKWRLKVWNSGNTVARMVTAKFDGDPQIIILDTEKMPYEELEPNKSFELILITHSGSANKFKVITEWDDSNGAHQSKSQIVSR